MYRKRVTRTRVTVLQHGLDRTTHDKTPFLSCAGMWLNVCVLML